VSKKLIARAKEVESKKLCECKAIKKRHSAIVFFAFSTFFRVYAEKSHFGLKKLRYLGKTAI